MVAKMWYNMIQFCTGIIVPEEFMLHLVNSGWVSVNGILQVKNEPTQVHLQKVAEFSFLMGLL